MTLTGETKGRPGNDSTRSPINIDRQVKINLNRLLYLPQFRGVGFSEFIQRAIDIAEREIEDEIRKTTRQ